MRPRARPRVPRRAAPAPDQAVLVEDRGTQLSSHAPELGQRISGRLLEPGELGLLRRARRLQPPQRAELHGDRGQGRPEPVVQVPAATARSSSRVSTRRCLLARRDPASPTACTAIPPCRPSDSSNAASSGRQRRVGSRATSTSPTWRSPDLSGVRCSTADAGLRPAVATSPDASTRTNGTRSEAATDAATSSNATWTVVRWCVDSASLGERGERVRTIAVHAAGRPNRWSRVRSGSSASATTAATMPAPQSGRSAPAAEAREVARRRRRRSAG